MRFQLLKLVKQVKSLQTIRFFKYSSSHGTQNKAPFRQYEKKKSQVFKQINVQNKNVEVKAQANYIRNNNWHNQIIFEILQLNDGSIKEEQKANKTKDLLQRLYVNTLNYIEKSSKQTSEINQNINSLSKEGIYLSSKQTVEINQNITQIGQIIAQLVKNLLQNRQAKVAFQLLRSAFLFELFVENEAIWIAINKYSTNQLDQPETLGPLLLTIARVYNIKCYNVQEKLNKNQEQKLIEAQNYYLSIAKKINQKLYLNRDKVPMDGLIGYQIKVNQLQSMAKSNWNFEYNFIEVFAKYVEFTKQQNPFFQARALVKLAKESQNQSSIYLRDILKKNIVQLAQQNKLNLEQISQAIWAINIDKCIYNSQDLKNINSNIKYINEKEQNFNQDSALSVSTCIHTLGKNNLLKNDNANVLQQIAKRILNKKQQQYEENSEQFKDQQMPGLSYKDDVELAANLNILWSLSQMHISIQLDLELLTIINRKIENYFDKIYFSNFSNLIKGYSNLIHRAQKSRQIQRISNKVLSSNNIQQQEGCLILTNAQIKGQDVELKAILNEFLIIQPKITKFLEKNIIKLSNNYLNQILNGLSSFPNIDSNTVQLIVQHIFDNRVDKFTLKDASITLCSLQKYFSNTNYHRQNNSIHQQLFDKCLDFLKKSGPQFTKDRFFKLLNLLQHSPINSESIDRIHEFILTKFSDYLNNMTFKEIYNSLSEMLKINLYISSFPKFREDIQNIMKKFLNNFNSQNLNSQEGEDLARLLTISRRSQLLNAEIAMLCEQKLKEILLSLSVDKKSQNYQVNLEISFQLFFQLSRYRIENNEIIELAENVFRENLRALSLSQKLHLIDALLIYNSKDIEQIRIILTELEKAFSDSTEILQINKPQEQEEQFFQEHYLYRLIFSLKLEYAEHIDLKKEFPKLNSLFEENEKNFYIVKESKQPFKKTNLESTIKQCLTQMKIPFIEEKIIGTYFIDFFVEPNICIEINGKLHYLEDSKQPNWLTVRKQRQIEKLGYKMVSIPYFEWIMYEKSAQKYNYLKQLIISQQ